MISIPVSIGEFIDKISILLIKAEKVDDIQKAKNINNELNLLLSKANIIDYNDISKLKEVNQMLWIFENDMRAKPSIEIATKICAYNDLRANIKKELNLKYKSGLQEEKYYST